ncbi:TlyA family RNA methyltransferase [Alkalibacterium sp. MB6]|uniref:TlyA family RNA methyltransferase n=1 Tax=Alkalibacterium sp. MB6 TaxID=2081965 RepID=UPI001379E257|nr:TlyA family RNA methyltransferase [Alkalibacterium sp. MB6]
MKKERVDDLLVQQGWAENRDQAKRLVMAGKAYTSKEEKLQTSGEKWPADTTVYVKGADQLYVSRGGLKLEKAIDYFNIDLSGKVVLDIGASTGGFTDVSLKNGAQLVYALDVGTNQLAWKLRIDKRVVVMEQTNFRHVTPADFKKGQPDTATIDVSFISLTKIIPVLKTILSPEGDAVILIKPQFEAHKEDVGEGGIILDPQVHESVLKQLIHFLYNQSFMIHGIIPSPIKGGKGNKEYLAYIKRVPTMDVTEKDLMKSLLTEDLFS